MTNNMHNYSTDVAIIGAGPIGIFTVFQCGMLGMKAVLVDAIDFIGGQCTALYPEKPIYDIPAYPEITGEGLIEKLHDQAAPFEPTILLNQQIVKFTKNNENDFTLITDKGANINAKAIIIAAGCGAFGPNKPPLQDLDKFEAKSVHYLVKKRADYKGKDIVIAGGGDSAVDWAISLSEVANSVTVVHRRDKFRCAPDSQKKLFKLAEDKKINLKIPFHLYGIEGNKNNGTIENIILKTLDGEEDKVKCDILLPFYGLAMDLGPIADWGLNLDKKHINVDIATMQTSIGGVYAIGDINTYEHKLKLISVGFAEAATASHIIRKNIFDENTYHFEYSTSKGKPS